MDIRITIPDEQLPAFAKLVAAEIREYLPATSGPAGELTMTIKQFHEKTGMAEKTILEKIHAGDIPATQFGKTGPWYICVPELLLKMKHDSQKNRNDAEIHV